MKRPGQGPSVQVMDEGFFKSKLIVRGEDNSHKIYELFGRGSHRCYMFGKLGYDFPMFLPKIDTKIGANKFYDVNLDTRNYFNNQTLRLLYNGQRKVAQWFRNIELVNTSYTDSISDD